VRKQQRTQRRRVRKETHAHRKIHGAAAMDEVDHGRASQARGAGQFGVVEEIHGRGSGTRKLRSSDQPPWQTSRRPARAGRKEGRGQQRIFVRSYGRWDSARCDYQGAEKSRG
jgi:hypothetical protein